MKNIIATGKAPLMPKGTTYIESDDVADVLVKTGAAVYDGEEIKVSEPNQKTGPQINTSDKVSKKK